MDEDEVVEAEIVDDGQDGRGAGDHDGSGLGTSSPDGDGSPRVHAPLARPDVILTPCHHGCTCGLHQQVVYGDRVPKHAPTDVDHGEMSSLVAAVGDATRMLNGFHEHFRKLRATAARTHGRANRALRELDVLLDSDAVRQARAERDQVEDAYTNLTPAERQPAPRWLKAVAVFAVVAVSVFDAVFFQQIFLDIMQVKVGDPWWRRDVGLLVAVVLAVGLVAAGRILTGPLWRLRHRWRRHMSPDEPPLQRTVRMARVVAVCAAPTVTFFVLGLWAAYRGQAGAATFASQGRPVEVVPSPLAVMVLLLSLALTVVVLEVLVYNPYQADLKRADRALAKVRAEITAGCAAASAAVDAHEITWRDLRSARDEVISFVQVELARPWEMLILPARLRHGRAGPKSAGAKHDVKIELIPDSDQVRISYQIFEGMVQPQPGPGPLAEVVRTLLELDPSELRDRQQKLENALHKRLGEPTPVPEPDQKQVPPQEQAADHRDPDRGGDA